MQSSAAVQPQRIRIPAYGWKPRKKQMNAWRARRRGIKRFVLVWHRRFGKDEFALQTTAQSIFERVGTYWHMLPEASQARKAIWNAVNPHTGRRRIDEVFPEEIRETTNNQDMFIRFKNGSTWQVVGSDNFNSLVGSPPVGVVFSEYALADPAAWAYLRPILAENGGWAMFISTPRGRNHLHALYEMAKDDPDWFAEHLTVEDTKALSKEIIEKERRELIKERGLDEGMAYFLQEYYCSFDSALPGAYYARLMVEADQQNRVGVFPYIAGVPVTTAWDLGAGDSTTIWFMQEVPLTADEKRKGLKQKLRIIDYHEASGMGTRYYADLIKSKPYVYREHILPHDGSQRHETEGEIAKTRAQMLEEHGLKNIRILPQRPLEDRHAAAREFIPRCQFNTTPIRNKGENEVESRERMARGLSALRMYHRKWDDRLKTFQNNPVHDWASHGADGFGYMAQGYRKAGNGPLPSSAWRDWTPAKKGDKPEPPECLDVLVSIVCDETDWWWQRWGVFEDSRNKNKLAAIILQVKQGNGVKELVESLKPSRKAGDSMLLWRDKELKTLRRELLRNEIVLLPVETPGIENAIDIAGQYMREGLVWAPAMQWAASLRTELDLYPYGQRGSEFKAFALAQLMNYIVHHGYLDDHDDEDIPDVDDEPRRSVYG